MFALPLYLIIRLPPTERVVLTLVDGERQSVPIFERFDDALSLLASYGIHNRFGAGKMDDPSQLLIWLKSARERGANEVCWNPEVDGATVEPEERSDLAELIEEVRQVVAAIGEMN